MAEQDLAAPEPLTPEQADPILRANAGGILVGGHAVLFWVDHYRLSIPSALSAGVTTDLDFFGTKKDAEQLRQVLEDEQFTVELRAGTFDEASPQAAVLEVRGLPGRKSAAVVDVMFALTGYGGKTGRTEKQLQRRAVVFEGGLSVMHPLDCLISKVANLHKHPRKRDLMGIGQCRLALKVATAYLAEEIARDERAAFRAIEIIANLAQQPEGVFVWNSYRINVLAAIPMKLIRSDKFREHRWPQVQKEVTKRRRADLRRRRVRNALK